MRILDGLMSVRQVADKLGHKGTDHVYDAINHGRKVEGRVVKLASVRVLGKIKVHPDDLEAFVAACNPGSQSIAVRRVAMLEDRTTSVPVNAAYPPDRRSKKPSTSEAGGGHSRHPRLPVLAGVGGLAR